MVVPCTPLMEWSSWWALPVLPADRCEWYGIMQGRPSWWWVSSRTRCWRCLVYKGFGNTVVMLCYFANQVLTQLWVLKNWEETKGAMVCLCNVAVPSQTRCWISFMWSPRDVVLPQEPGAGAVWCVEKFKETQAYQLPFVTPCPITNPVPVQLHVLENGKTSVMSRSFTHLVLAQLNVLRTWKTLLLCSMRPAGVHGTCPGGSHWDRRVCGRHLRFLHGLFQRHLLGPHEDDQEQCDRWKHRTLWQRDRLGRLGVCGRHKKQHQAEEAWWESGEIARSCTPCETHRPYPETSTHGVEVENPFKGPHYRYRAIISVNGVVADSVWLSCAAANMWIPLPGRDTSKSEQSQESKKLFEWCLQVKYMC